MEKSSLLPPADRIVDITKAYFDSKYIAILNDIRIKSLNNLALFMNITPEELFELLYESLTEFQGELLAYYQATNKEPVYAALLEAVANMNDLGSKFFAQEFYHKTQFIDTLLEYYDGIWKIQSPYIDKLLKILPYPLERIETKDDYYDFLFQIPTVFSSDLDFNAQVFEASPDDKLPIVRINYLMSSVVENYLETVGYVILDSDDGYVTSKLRSLPTIREKSMEQAVVASLISFVMLIKGEIPAMVKVKLDETLSHNLHYVFGAPILPFLTFHEFGHLLSGHLELPYYKEMETEADLFALYYVKSLIKNKGSGIKFRLFLGLASIFVLLDIRERVLSLMNQSQYPTAMERFVCLCSTFSEDDRKKLCKAYNNVLLATDYTLKKVYNIELPIAVIPDESGKNGDVNS